MDYKIIESFHYGHSIHAYKVFGAHFVNENGLDGVRFTLWAPHARHVSVVGSFNNWNGTDTQMERITNSGIFSLFIPGVKKNDLYKYRIVDNGGNVFDKADPFAYFSELRPNTASVCYDVFNFKWTDSKWMKARTKNFDKPLNIYEVFAGAWKFDEDGKPLNYVDLANQLIPYVKEHGFTHIELMPLNEHPFDGSWGYQANGYYSCTSRYGEPKEFAKFVDMCHKNNIGVIMDVVPVHFVKDSHGLRMFDGQPLYEYEKDYDANSEWGTCNFDLWKEEVRSFLMSSCSFWADIYHVDGIRFDAISNLIFWSGNKGRGTNEGALAFVKRMNYYLSKEYQGLMLIAEDSSDFPKVTALTIDGGLGFDYKWDLGWMNDTLSYYKLDPIYRKWHHNKINFSMAYFYSEKYLMPFSHDEVVHGKLTIIDRMWGNYEQKFAQARNIYLYMFTHPGKKLNFMGNEMAMYREFDEKKELDWFMLKYPAHDAFLRYFTDLSKIYIGHPSLYRYDYEYKGFKWIDADNNQQSIYTYYREAEEEVIVVVLNMTPVSYEHFRVNVPYKGKYVELINSEKDIYDGCNMCNYEPLKTINDSLNKQQYLDIRVAPFAGIMFIHKKAKKKDAKKKGKENNV